jgi:septal ring factor EnvC (AmiA/AmiB activator)
MARPASGTNLTIAQLKRVLNEKQSELTKLHRQRAQLQKRLNQLDRQIERVGGGLSGTRGGGGGRARNEQSLIEAIESVLGKAGKPLQVSQILEGVLATGYRSGSANFRGIINQTLIKDKRFGQVERGVYGLKKK